MFQDVGVSKDLNEQFKQHLVSSGSGGSLDSEYSHNSSVHVYVYYFHLIRICIIVFPVPCPGRLFQVLLCLC